MSKDAIDRLIASLAIDPDSVSAELETVNASITHEMLADHRSTGPRFFIDEIGGEYFMIPIEHRMDWYAYDQRMEEGVGPETLPDYVYPVESLCHLEFAQPEEPFV